jgi:amphiphysin
MATLFSPMGAEYNLASKHPHSEVTLNNISVYQTLMEELRGESAPPMPLYALLPERRDPPVSDHRSH